MLEGISYRVPYRADALSRAVLDAQFAESDHPRAPDGKFGAGAGGASSSGKKEDDLHTVKTVSRPTFVSTFLNEHNTISGQEKYLSTLGEEKLHTALRLSEGHIDPASTHVRQLISKELASRKK